VPLTFITEGKASVWRLQGILAEAMMTTQDCPVPQNPGIRRARFPRAVRLLRHADFERVYKAGRRHFSASMTVFYLPRAEEAVQENGKRRAGSSAPHVAVPLGMRVGFTVGRALGDAVDRNRMKRRLREAVRLSLPAAIIPADVVINPKKILLKAEFSDVRSEVARAFEVIEKKLIAKPGSVATTVRTAGDSPREAGNRKTGSCT
jgi:ribonuclease P protein component